jgi:hypothetical protein
VVLVYDIGPEGGRHSYKNATKVINSTIINNPKKWITDVMVHHQKYVGLCLLDIDIEYEDDVRRKAKDVENAWRKYQKIQATKGELLEVPAEKLVIEREWEDKIIRDAESHLQWLETEKDQILPIVTKLQQDLVDWQTYLKKICRLLEIEQEQISLLRELEDRQYKYWRTLIKAPD